MEHAPDQDLWRHLGRLDEPDAVVIRLERMLNLVLKADVAQRPLVAPHKLRRIQVTEGPPQVIRVCLVEGLRRTRGKSKKL